MFTTRLFQVYILHGILIMELAAYVKKIGRDQ